MSDGASTRLAMGRRNMIGRAKTGFLVQVVSGFPWQIRGTLRAIGEPRAAMESGVPRDKAIWLI